MLRFYLGIFPVGGIHNCSAANLTNPFPMTIKTPTANFVGTNDILDEKYTTTKSKGELVKQLNVFEEVVVRRTGVAVLVVMTVDQKFDYWFQSISLDKCL